MNVTVVVNLLLPCSEAQARDAADTAEAQTRQAGDTSTLQAAKNYTEAQVAR